MKISDWFINFSYHPFLIRTLRFLHLRDIMRKVYYWFICPKEKIVVVNIAGIKAQFYVKTPLELRTVGVVSMGQLSGERLVLNKILESLQEGEIAYDIGANIGVHTIFMALRAKNSGKVVAFEPEKKSYDALLENIKLNNLENVMAMQLALGDKVSDGRLHWKNKIIGSYSLVGQNQDDLIDQAVKILPGDLLIKQEDIPFPNVVKIDVEGYEYYVLQGMRDILTSRECRMICCEMHPSMFAGEVSSEMIVELIKTYGFNRIEQSAPGDTFHLFCYRR